MSCCLPDHGREYQAAGAATGKGSSPVSRSAAGHCLDEDATGLVSAGVGHETVTARVAAPTQSPDEVEMVRIEAGGFRMGCDRREGAPGDGEWPARPVQMSAFWMDRHAVSNRRFARFVQQTGYITDAEQQGWSFVFAGLLPNDFAPTRGVASAPWWRQVEGACWKHPHGPQSDLSDALDLPVVHVSHHDALAFCAWAGKQLPTESQWERAARGGQEGRRFPWGDEEWVADGASLIETDSRREGTSLNPSASEMLAASRIAGARCNVWQGVFPSRNDCSDGYYGLAPVDAFAPNDFGLYNMVGNCWEWCSDWFEPDWAAQQVRAAAGGLIIDPTGPQDGDHRVLRGGSFLCHPSYCWRYRNAARSASTPDSSTGHIGFRCVDSRS